MTETKPLQILAVGMHATAAAGGLDRYFHDLSRQLALSPMVQLRGLCFTGGQEGASPDYLMDLGPAGKALPARLWRIRQAVATRRDPDALLVSHFALHGLALPRGRPLIVHFHGPWALESAAEGGGTFSVALKKWLETRVYRRARHIICLSDAFRQILVDEYGIAPEVITVIPGGIYPERFDHVSRPQARASLGWPAERPTIVCVRRLAHRMGLENLIQAFAKVRERHPTCKLVIGGKGPLREELSALITKLQLAGAVELVGFVTEERLPLLYAAADFSVVPSQSLEGFGLVTLESLASGTPVLVTPVGGLPEAVSALSPDLVLAGSDVAALEQGLNYALSNLGSLPSPEACRRYARQHFDWQLITERILEVYRATAHE